MFRACMLPMLAPCTGLGPAVFTCPLFFGVAHFHHIIEQLRFRQSSVGSIFVSAGEAWRAAEAVKGWGALMSLIDTLRKGLETEL